MPPPQTLSVLALADYKMLIGTKTRLVGVFLFCFLYFFLFFFFYVNLCHGDHVRIKSIIIRISILFQGTAARLTSTTASMSRVTTAALASTSATAIVAHAPRRTAALTATVIRVTSLRRVEMAARA